VTRAASAAHVVLIAGLAVSGCAAFAPDAMSAACASGQPGPILGEWVLERIDGAEWTRTSTLSAGASSFSGRLVCNGYGTYATEGEGPHYDIVDGRLIIPDGVVMTTAGCLPRDLMEFEVAYLSVLESEPHVARIGETGLCLYTDDGRSLEFRRLEAEERAS
jgi:heat shock protein HslJ